MHVIQNPGSCASNSRALTKYLWFLNLNPQKETIPTIHSQQTDLRKES